MESYELKDLSVELRNAAMNLSNQAPHACAGRECSQCYPIGTASKLERVASRLMAAALGMERKVGIDG